MKLFLKNFLSVSLIVIGISLTIEFLLLTRPNIYSYKSNYVESHADDIQCLLLGNSHIEEALIPDSMGMGIFNMAISGRYLEYDVALAEKHLPNMHNLRVLIVPYDYFEFYLGRNDKDSQIAMMKKGAERTIKCMNYKYMGLRVDNFIYWSEILNSDEKFMASFVSRDDELVGCDSLGYVALRLSKKRIDWKNKGLPDKVDLNKKKNKELSQQLDEKFQVLAEITKELNVKLVLLSTPMYEAYRERMNNTLIKEMASFVNKLQYKYPHIEYFDYTFDDRFVDDDFKDASHLSDVGAAKFSKIVKEEILDNKL